MKSTRFYKLIIALLVVINIGTLLFMWFGKPPHPPRPGDEPRLANDIGLTGEDKTTVDKLEIQHHIDKSALMRRDSELHKEMFDLVGSGEEPDSIQALLHTNKEEIERMTFDFFDEVAKHCDAKQLKILKEFIQRRVRHMGPPGPPR